MIDLDGRAAATGRKWLVVLSAMTVEEAFFRELAAEARRPYRVNDPLRRRALPASVSRCS